MAASRVLVDYRGVSLSSPFTRALEFEAVFVRVIDSSFILQPITQEQMSECAVELVSTPFSIEILTSSSGESVCIVSLT